MQINQFYLTAHNLKEIGRKISTAQVEIQPPACMGLTSDFLRYYNKQEYSFV
jgi:hypothetical protein